ncbi:hypothetical protein [Geminicoccus roseus]|uniref:hypothetical protein n=1 Tax=Geminicoccus roseus TaxID=404900 RepID=UPI0012F867F6|nr:hypothetical protein [Geminicoccus roseus]
MKRKPRLAPGLLAFRKLLGAQPAKRLHSHKIEHSRRAILWFIWAFPSRRLVHLVPLSTPSARTRAGLVPEAPGRADRETGSLSASMPDWKTARSRRAAPRLPTGSAERRAGQSRKEGRVPYKIDPAVDRQYIEEMRKKPIGAHSPGLQRVLNTLRTDKSGRQVILVVLKPFEKWVLGEMPADRRDPITIEDGPVFTSREEAEWEIFRRRWLLHTGENINLPFKD